VALFDRPPKTVYNLNSISPEPLSAEEFKVIEALSVDDFISEKEGFVTVTSIVKVQDAEKDVVKEAFKNIDNSIVIDRQGMNEDLLGNFKKEFNQLIVYCLGIVVVLLLLFYRNWKVTLATVVPIVLTWFVTVGLMGLFGLEFNIFNVIISTFIFGLGVDYSIFITNGLLQQANTAENTLKTHKTSILLSVITTLLGVGVLIFAKHPALYSMSAVTIIGIFSAMLIAFTIQPLLFKVLIFKRKKE